MKTAGPVRGASPVNVESVSPQRDAGYTPRLPIRATTSHGQPGPVDHEGAFSEAYQAAADGRSNAMRLHASVGPEEGQADGYHGLGGNVGPMPEESGTRFVNRERSAVTETDSYTSSRRR